jgi:hypothetical protein
VARVPEMRDRVSRAERFASSGATGVKGGRQRRSACSATRPGGAGLRLVNRKALSCVLPGKVLRGVVGVRPLADFSSGVWVLSGHWRAPQHRLVAVLVSAMETRTVEP